MFNKLNFLIVLLLAGLAFGQNSRIHHKVRAEVNPEKYWIAVSDQITIPSDQVNTEMYFYLNDDLKASSYSPEVTLSLVEENVGAMDKGMDQEGEEVSSRIKQNKYLLKIQAEANQPVTFTLDYSGTIHYPVQQMSEEYARGFSTSPGIIDTQGVYLAGSSDWIPYFNEGLITFELTTVLPAAWDVVSQGKRTAHEVQDGLRITTWDSPEPMEEIFLIAAKFHEYTQPAGNVTVMAFLRTPDESLAQKYLETTAQYLEMYRQLVGPFPFSKFALVENFWETGYGMPSFTLLGEKVIRFPFILHSSYPHELLHNWWGNSAYVDFESGNWCEGITAYMADHLIKEQRGQGADYRRSTLQKYTDYVTPETDFPLNKFLSRTNAASEAIGYGKSLMMWNMLREEIGDESFIKSMQTFYRQNKYKNASFDDIRLAAEQVTGKDFNSFFRQWVDRTGAPELNLSGVEREKTNGGYNLSFTISQVQDEDAFTLQIPIAVTCEDETVVKKIAMTGKQQVYSFIFTKKPLFIQVDPQFQLFRKLHALETPPALSKIMGASDLLIILPSREADEQIQIYRNLADIWAKDLSKNIEIKLDSEVTDLPKDRAVWLLGAGNKFRPVIESQLNEYGTQLVGNDITLGKSTLSIVDNSVVVVVRHPKDPASVVVWLTVSNKEAVAGLSRKLPHYGKYSYLAFEGTEPTNNAKGQWQVLNSPLNFQLSFDEKPATHLPIRPALAMLAPVFSAEQMMEHVNFLASEEMHGRGLGTPELDQAANYIADKFKAFNLEAGADNGSYFQTWPAVINANGDKGPVKNVIGVLPGTNPKMAGESVVISAHYDHLGLGWPDVREGNAGKIHFGADDNASGVAVMLELARILGKNARPQRTIVFVAFTAEENGLVGSNYYVQNYQKFPVKKVIANLNLDTVGRLGNNKLLVLNADTAREWKFIFMGASYVTGVESETITQPLDASDQGSFIAAGIPAVQIFSGANRDYHRSSDTVDKIDEAGLVKVATFVREGINYLAEREEPMAFTGKTGGHPSQKLQEAKGNRAVTTGSMPDFSYSGKGVKIGGLSEDSPAAKAGLQKGDVIIKLGEDFIENLRGYSNALKKHQPGDKVQLTYQREGKSYTTELVLVAR